MSSNIFLIIALITTGIFVIQFILSIFFGDIDTEIDIDADISSVVSFKGLTHFGIGFGDRKSTRLNSSHNNQSRMPSSA